MTLPTPFDPGFRLTDGTKLNERIANPVWSISEVLTATVGGSAVNSARVTNAITNVTTAAAANAGIVLPQALPGKILVVANDTANNITVFAEGTSSIGGVPGSVGVLQNAGFCALYIATSVDYWSFFEFYPSTGNITKYQFISALLLMAPPANPTLLYQAVPMRWDNPTTIQFNTSAYVAVGSPVYNLCQTTYGYTPAQMATLMSLAATVPQWG
jgi:hypothetical protein